ncbi:MAG: SLC26A/SulP transporter family protein, partial [Rhizobiales bacterium]|nr:SLC26A/SulP transporter family protein [Hyphomicrobiales bacterium]
WRPVTPDLLARADWAAIGGEWPILASAVALAVVGLLLNATGIEFASHREVDLDQELRAAGMANIAVGIGGGLIGFQGLGLTVLADRMGGRHRLVGVVVALLSALALFAGASLLSLVPRMVVGAVTVFIGLDFLLTWLLESRRRLPPAEYAIVLLIFLASVAIGFLEGVAFGLFAGFVLFVISYSRAGLIRHHLDRGSFRSNVDWSPADEQRLREAGAGIEILVLEGYMFFGTAHRLVAEVEARGGGRTQPIRFIVLDFRLVSGIDSSAVHAFEKLRRLAERRAFTIVLCGLSPAVLAQFRRDAGGGEIGMPVLPDLDRAVEWCERGVLEADAGRVDAPEQPLPAVLAREIGDTELSRRIASGFEPVEAADGTVIIEAGSSGRELYYVETGRVVVQDVDGAGTPRRLRSILAGNVVGEIGFYLDQPRTATVAAEGACRLQRITREALERMERDEPRAAAELHKFVFRHTAQRLGDANRLLRALTR